METHHTAIRYGNASALDAVAKPLYDDCGSYPEEYEIVVRLNVFHIRQSGDDCYVNVDKMIMKETDVLPHGLINHVETKP